ncbi:sterigmatocystin 8-O-methyltransferase precursor [Aspergillus karnatakaensis]|uniref:sterigmatocystin 8-O-methyltransferase precursor n=1 Tax=Aspergillus karnatakaensis TaxID=1810916 RepID=UPI003CCCDC9F
MSAVSLGEQIIFLTETANAAAKTLDEESRKKALKAARGLVDALSSPVETAIQDVSLNLAVPLALRMGVQLEVFTAIRDHQGEGATTQAIAGRTGASPIVVSQVLKVLTATGYVREVGVQLYKASPLTMVMADPIMEATTRATFDIGHFLRDLANNTKISYFDWLGENPSLAKDFQQFMTAKQQKTPCWVDWFDVDGLILDGFRKSENGEEEGILLVDVGGGEGHYTHAFNHKFPKAPGRRIIQDLPHVVSSIPTPPEKTELLAHDIFKPQPVKGARVYYLHWILHDWSDERAREILSNIAASMEPGYSRLVINENIIPDTNCDFAVACLNILMTVQVGSLERTELQWRELLNSAGLTEMSFHQPPGEGEGVIVATKT